MVYLFQGSHSISRLLIFFFHSPPTPSLHAIVFSLSLRVCVCVFHQSGNIYVFKAIYKVIVHSVKKAHSLIFNHVWKASHKQSSNIKKSRNRRRKIASSCTCVYAIRKKACTFQWHLFFLYVYICSLTLSLSISFYFCRTRWDVVSVR